MVSVDVMKVEKWKAARDDTKRGSYLEARGQRTLQLIVTAPSYFSAHAAPETVQASLRFRETPILGTWMNRALAVCCFHVPGGDESPGSGALDLG